ncbi:MAG: cytochrome C [Burkholderiales bacterium]
MLVAFLFAWPASSADRVVPADALAREAGTTVIPILDSVQDYSRNCQGCHGHTGISVAEVPDLKDRVGYFVHTPGGRRFLVQVPGVALSMLDDRRLAELLNWILRTYSPAQLPGDFRPYGEQEVAQWRKSPLKKVLPARDEVIRGLVQAGVIDSPERLAFKSLGGTR